MAALKGDAYSEMLTDFTERARQSSPTVQVSSLGQTYPMLALDIQVVRQIVAEAYRLGLAHGREHKPKARWPRS
jgi:hypothetical protein